MKYVLLFGLAAASAWSQQLDLSSLDKLESKAEERSIIDLDPEKLKLASGLLSDDKAKANIIAGMKGVFIRSYEGTKSGDFTVADLDAVRSQLKGPKWSRMMDIREKNESTEIWFFTENGKMGGMAILAVEPSELTVVNIVGSIDLNSVSKVAGSLGIPEISTGFGAGAAPKKPATTKGGGSKDEDE